MWMELELELELEMPRKREAKKASPCLEKVGNTAPTRFVGLALALAQPRKALRLVTEHDWRGARIDDEIIAKESKGTLSQGTWNSVCLKAVQGG